MSTPTVLNPEDTVTNPSLYIHYTIKSTTKKKVFAVFCKSNIGRIDRVDEISRVVDNREFKSFFVHFSYWFDNKTANDFKDKISTLKDGKNTKERVYVFDTGVYWNVTKSNQRKPSLEELEEQRKLEACEKDDSEKEIEIIDGKTYIIRNKMEDLTAGPMEPKAYVKYIKEDEKWVMYVVWESEGELARKKIN